LPSALFVSAESSAFDVTVLLAARLGSADGAAWSSILNSLLIFVSGAGGLSGSACTKVGASLGAGYPSDAKRYASTAILACIAISLLNAAVIYSFYDVILSLFGATTATLHAGYSIQRLVPIFHIADSVQFCFQGIFSGAGQNHRGALILLACLWAVGMPMSVLLGFYFNMGLNGIVLGLCLGLLLEIPLFAIEVARFDWAAISAEVQIDSDEEETEETEESNNEEMTEHNGKTLTTSITEGCVSSRASVAAFDRGVTPRSDALGVGQNSSDSVSTPRSVPTPVHK